MTTRSHAIAVWALVFSCSAKLGASPIEREGREPSFKLPSDLPMLGPTFASPSFDLSIPLDLIFEIPEDRLKVLPSLKLIDYKLNVPQGIEGGSRQRDISREYF